MNAAFEEPASATRARPLVRQVEPSVADRLCSALGFDDTAPRAPARGLALPRLTVYNRHSALRYAVTAIDVWGRVADRTLVQALGWEPGRAVTISVRQGVIAVRPDRRGRHHLTRQGHLRVPASVRHLVHLAGGDRLLLAASPHRDLLLAYPVYVLDAMLVAYHCTNGPR